MLVKLVCIFLYFHSDEVRLNIYLLPCHLLSVVLIYKALFFAVGNANRANAANAETAEVSAKFKEVIVEKLK